MNNNNQNQKLVTLLRLYLRFSQTLCLYLEALRSHLHHLGALPVYTIVRTNPYVVKNIKPWENILFYTYFTKT